MASVLVVDALAARGGEKREECCCDLRGGLLDCQEGLLSEGNHKDACRCKLRTGTPTSVLGQSSQRVRRYTVLKSVQHLRSRAYSRLSFLRLIPGPHLGMLTGWRHKVKALPIILHCLPFRPANCEGDDVASALSLYPTEPCQPVNVSTRMHDRWLK